MIEIQNYIAKFKHFPLLTAKEERAMLELIRTPPEGTPKDATDWVLTQEQKDARDEFICRNIRLVIHTAKGFCNLEDRRILDFISAGVQGMLHSLDTFDLDRGVRFSTYANWWIKAKIRNEIKFMDTKVVRYKTLFNEFRKLRNSYLLDKKFKSDEELFEELGWCEVKIFKFQEDQERLKISLDSITTAANDFSSDDNAILVEPPQEEILDDLFKQEQIDLLYRGLETLTKEQKQIVSAHFGLNGEDKTYDVLAQEMGLTREKVRQIENRALSKIWRFMRNEAPSLCE